MPWVGHSSTGKDDSGWEEMPLITQMWKLLSIQLATAYHQLPAEA